MKAYSTEHFLTFILEIPSITNDKHNLTIIPQSKFPALGNEGYTYLKEGNRIYTSRFYTSTCK